MKIRQILLLPALAALLLSGCGSEEVTDTAGAGGAVAAPADDSAKATAEFVVAELQAGRPIVLWQSLPEKYQQDTNDLVRTFARNMDPEIWKQVVGILGSVTSLLSDKQQFFLNHPEVAESENAESLKTAIPAVTSLLQTILDSAGDLEKLKTFDGGEYLTGPGATVMQNLVAVTEAMPPQMSGNGSMDPGTLLKPVTVETVSESGDSATLKFTTPDGKSNTETFTRVDGKWLPAQMVAEWEQNMTKARGDLAKLPETVNGIRMPVMMAAGAVPGLLAPLQAAETQEDFNAAVDALQGQAMGMMMQSMGGGRPGGFGPSPGADAEYPLEEPAFDAEPVEVPGEASPGADN